MTTTNSSGAAALPLIAMGRSRSSTFIRDKDRSYRRLDVLINNAGVGARTNIQCTDMETFDRVFNTNLRGVYNLTRLLVPALKEARGNIVNISSVHGTMASEGSLPYSMTKAALDHFTKCVALELAPHGVRVNTISPGFTVSTIVTRMTGLSDEQYQGWMQQAARNVPMGAVCAAEDIAQAVAHVASDLSRLVTGVILQVDGGLNVAGFGMGGSSLMQQQMK